MKTIYLDRQIVVESYQGNKEVNEAIAIAKKNGFIFPYSPAHIEEIAGAECREKCHDLPEQIEHLKGLSEEWAFMPDPHQDIRLRKENIGACLSRVRDSGGRDLTECANQIELDRLDKYRELYRKDAQWGSIHKRIQKCTWNEVFLDSDVFQYLNMLAVTKGFRIFVNTFSEKEKVIEILFNVLDLFKFKKEDNEKRIENRMHDITHAIYASSADIFVTNDGKLNNRTKAIFHLLQINAQILDRQEFLDFVGTLQHNGGE